MSVSFDNFFKGAEIPIECPGCRHKFKEQWGRLESAKHITCPGCHQTIELQGNQSLIKARKEMGDSLAKFRKTIADFGKKR